MHVLAAENKRLREQVSRLTVKGASSTSVHALSTCPPCPPSAADDASSGSSSNAVCFTATTGGRTVTLLPIGRLPESHPALAKPWCGTKLTSNDPIPAKSLAPWTLGGQQSWGKPGGCTNKKLRKKKYYEQTAPQLFYAFGYPAKNTGNPGYYSPDAASLYPIVDAEQNVYFVLTLDVHALPPTPVSPPRVMPSLPVSSCPCHLPASCRRSQRRPRTPRPPPSWR